MPAGSTRLGCGGSATCRGGDAIRPGLLPGEDLLMPGLVARKRDRGLTFWLVAMRNGRRHKQRLGAWPALSLAEAKLLKG